MKYRPRFRFKLYQFSDGTWACTINHPYDDIPQGTYTRGSTPQEAIADALTLMEVDEGWPE